MVKAVALLKTAFILAACFLLTFTVGCSIPRLVNGGFWESAEDPGQDPVAGEEAEGQVNILLLGIDARKGETRTRSDTIMLARIDKKTGKVAIVSIPRDTRIEVPGSSVPKINHACAVGGPELTCKTVSKLMGEKIDYYILTNFNGFKDIVETLGGVTIDVDQRMKRLVDDINLHPGVQRLNGRQALAFVRYRSYALGDISRAEHQQKFLMALVEEMFQTRTITKLHKLVPQIAKNVETNLSLAQMASLAKMASDFKPENLYTQTLPGYFYEDPRSGIDYWIADEKIAQSILEDLLAGKKVAVVQETPVSQQSRPVKSSSAAGKSAKPAAPPANNNEDITNANGNQDNNENNSAGENAGEAPGNSSPDSNTPPAAGTTPLNTEVIDPLGSVIPL